MKKALAMAVVGALALGACGDDDGSGAPEVEGAWARTSPMAADVGAVYMRIESPDDDRLMAVTVEPSVAARVEIHETVMADDSTSGTMPSDTMAEGTMPSDTMAEGTMPEGTMPEGDMSGAMTMQQIPSLELPAGETVSLEPGGYHIMLLELAEPLVVGETFDATLVFETAEPLTITVEVRDEAP